MRSSGDPAINVALAIENAREALEIFKETPDSSRRAFALSFLGRASRRKLSGSELANSFEALRYHKLAVDLWEQAGMRMDLVEEWVHLAVAQRDIGRLSNNLSFLEESSANLERAYAESQALGMILPAIRLELLITRSELFSVNTPSVVAVEQVIKMAEETWISMLRGDRESLHKVQSALSSLIAVSAVQHSDNSMLTRAVSFAKAAENRFGGVAGIGEEELASLYSRLGGAFAKFARFEEAELHYARAEDVARSRLRKVVSLTAASGVSRLLYSSAGAHAYILAKRGALVDSIEILDKAIGLSLDQGYCGELLPVHFERDTILSKLERSVGLSEQELDEGVERLAEINSFLEAQLAHTDHKLNQKAEELVRLIPPGSAVLIPLFGQDEGIMVFAHRPSDKDEPSVSAIDCPDLERALRELRAVRPESPNIAARQEAERLAAGLASLGKVLRQSLIPRLRESRPTPLYIVAHGLCAGTPWHAAHWNEGGERRFLDDECPVSTIPSLRWLGIQQPQTSSLRRTPALLL